MKKISVILMALLFVVSFLFISCQKEKMKQPSGAGPEVKTEQQQATMQSVGNEVKVSPLTDEEEKLVEKIGTSGFQTPEAFSSGDEAKRYLRALLKGDYLSIRWYQNYRAKYNTPLEELKTMYDGSIETVISAIGPDRKGGFDLIVEVLKTRQGYPLAMAAAAKTIKMFKDKNTILLLRDTVKNPNPTVRLEAAGALLLLGDADTALPVLEELTEKEGYVGSLYYLYSAPGKIIDERGYKIVEKALSNPRAEVRISAVKLLLDAKKIKKEQAGEIALEILDKLKNNTLKDYGLTYNPKGVADIIPLPGSTTDVQQAEKRFRSDSRACDYTIAMFKNIKNKKALSLLKNMRSKNTEWWYVCKRGIEESIKAIEEDGGGK